MEKREAVSQNITANIPSLNSYSNLTKLNSTQQPFKATIKQRNQKPLKDECPNNDPAQCNFVFDEGYKSYAQEVSSKLV